MKFSIIIPIYNRTAFIETTLDSVFAQTYREVEVVCVDDCSTDNGFEKLEGYALKDTRVKLVRHQKNLGPHCARKTGVQNASGDYVLFLDCDDSLKPTACSVLYEALACQPLDMLEFAYRNKREVSYPVPFITIENVFDSLVYFKNPRAGTVWNKAYKTELLQQAFVKMQDFFSVMGEDLYESVVIAYYAKSYGFINDSLLYYNDETGISNKRDTLPGVKRILESIKRTLEAFDLFFHQYAPEKQNAVANIERQYIKYVFYYHILMHTHKSDWREALNLLPEYFSADALVPYAYKIKQPTIGLHYELFKYRCNMELRKRIPPQLKMTVKKLLGIA